MSDIHDAFAPFDWAIEDGALPRGQLSDLLEMQIRTASAMRRDHVVVPLKVAQLLLEYSRERPKGQGAGAGRASRSAQQRLQRQAIIGTGRQWYVELRRERQGKAAEKAAERAHDLAIQLGINDLSLSTILDRIKRR